VKAVLKKIKNVLWDYNDFKRGVIMGLISIIIYYILQGGTSIWGYYDEAFARSWVQPYGALWYVLNPFFQNWKIYSITTVIIYAGIIAPQIYLAKKGKISPWIVLLNIMSAVFFRVNQTSQDMTVIAFAPLATINPWFGALLILQKMAVGFSWNLSDPYFGTWVNQARGDPWEMPYLFLIGWFVFPLMVWAKGHVKFTKRKVLIILIVIAVIAIILILRQHQTCLEVTPPGAPADGYHDVWVCQ